MRGDVYCPRLCIEFPVRRPVVRRSTEETREAPRRSLAGTTTRIPPAVASAGGARWGGGARHGPGPRGAGAPHPPVRGRAELHPLHSVLRGRDGVRLVRRPRAGAALCGPLRPAELVLLPLPAVLPRAT